MYFYGAFPWRRGFSLCCVSFRIMMESSNLTGLAEVESSQDSQICVLAAVLIKLSNYNCPSLFNYEEERLIDNVGTALPRLCGLNPQATSQKHPNIVNNLDA